MRFEDVIIQRKGGKERKGVLTRALPKALRLWPGRKVHSFRLLPSGAKFTGRRAQRILDKE
ncbi:MAG: hypothetical protein JWM16_5327 [Verrucomicrobiales bacterium]|nr:hypothetical protein [Verrucomicrobiales bacterium]